MKAELKIAKAFSRATACLPRHDELREGIQGIIIRDGYLGATDGAVVVYTRLRELEHLGPARIPQARASTLALGLREGEIDLAKFTRMVGDFMDPNAFELARVVPPEDLLTLNVEVATKNLVKLSSWLRGIALEAPVDVRLRRERTDGKPHLNYQAIRAGGIVKFFTPSFRVVHGGKWLGGYWRRNVLGKLIAAVADARIVTVFSDNIPSILGVRTGEVVAVAAPVRVLEEP